MDSASPKPALTCKKHFKNVILGVYVPAINLNTNDLLNSSLFLIFIQNSNHSLPISHSIRFSTMASARAITVNLLPVPKPDRKSDAAAMNGGKCYPGCQHPNSDHSKCPKNPRTAQVPKVARTLRQVVDVVSEPAAAAKKEDKDEDVEMAQAKEGNFYRSLFDFSSSFFHR